MTTTTSTFKCALQQSRTREDTVNEAVAVSDWNLYLEPAAAGEVGAGDWFTVDSVDYEIDGQPWTVLNHRTAEIDHVECRARRAI